MKTEACLLVGSELYEEQNNPSDLCETDETILSYQEQEAELASIKAIARQDPEQAVLLLDFAARPDRSLLLRSFALDDGVSTIANAVEDQPWYEKRYGKPVSEGQKALYDQFAELIPEYFSPSSARELAKAGDGPWMQYNYVPFFKQIAQSEGIAYLAPASAEEHRGMLELPQQIPEVPSLLLRQLIGSPKPADINSLSPNVGGDVLALALDFRSQAYQRAIVDGQPGDLPEFARLWRLTAAGGAEHKAPIDFLYQLPEAQRKDYAHTFNRLYDAQALLDDFFPGTDISQAARSLTANALFAVTQHIHDGMRTQGKLSLRQAGELDVSMLGDEPLNLLRKLTDKIEQAHDRITKAIPVIAVESDDFTIFDFPATDPQDSLHVTQYIREKGSYNCNYRFEYGGRKPGVAASIDWRLDENLAGSPRPFHKVSRTDESLSIRLDRDVNSRADIIEGPGEATLDIGSLLGVGFGRDIALLLAYGNKLRSAAIAAEAKLNHQTENIPSELGSAEEFAKLARNQQVRLRRLASYAVLDGVR